RADRVVAVPVQGAERVPVVRVGTNAVVRRVPGHQEGWRLNACVSETAERGDRHHRNGRGTWRNPRSHGTLPPAPLSLQKDTGLDKSAAPRMRRRPLVEPTQRTTDHATFKSLSKKDARRPTRTAPDRRRSWAA